MPSSSDLDEGEFRARQQIVAAGYGLVAAIAFVVGLLVAIDGGDAGWIHNGSELVLLVLPAAGLYVASSRVTTQLLTCTGVLLSCGMLVHGTNGLIEAHFSFFVTLPLIALYVDWRPFAYSIAYVAISHGVVGAVAPDTMYNHDAALRAPFLWGLIHATFVLALCAVMLVHWNSQTEGDSN